MVTRTFNASNASGVVQTTVLNITPMNAPLNYSGSIVSGQSLCIDDYTGSSILASDYINT